MVAESHPMAKPAKTRKMLFRLLAGANTAASASTAAHTMPTPMLQAVYVRYREFVGRDLSGRWLCYSTIVMVALRTWPSSSARLPLAPEGKTSRGESGRLRCSDQEFVPEASR